METVFIKIANMSIAAGWLILAVMAMRLLFKRAPKWIACLLWAAVAIRLVCPFSFESALSLIPSAETISPSMLYAQEPVIHSGIPIINSAVNPVISESFAPAVGASVNPLQVWTAAASRGWMLGVAAMLVYALISYLRLCKRVRASLNTQNNIWICDDIKTPFILGIVKPRIYLPSDMDAAQMAHVVAHENAHLKRRDHWWKPLGFLLLALHWFNPLCWLAYILLCRDIELACDEKVIRAMEKDDMVAYSEALLSCSAPRRMVTACPLAFGEAGVKSRIKTALNYKKPAFWIVILAVVACVVVAVCFLTNPAKPPIELDSIQITWANALDLRPNDPISRDLNDAQLDELKSRLRTLGIGRKDGGFSGFTPLYSLSIQAQSHPQIMIAGYNGDGSRMALMIQNEYYRLDDPDFARYVSAVCAGEDAAATQKTLTLDDALALSEKGEALTWADFEGFSHIDTGSGLYIRAYEIDEQFSLLIGGPEPSQEPWYIRLVSKADHDAYVDVRTGDVEGFIVEYGGSVSAMGGADEPQRVANSASPLDAAISAAVLDHNKGRYRAGDFACESHVILASEAGEPAAANQIDTVTVFAMVFYQVYDFTDAGFERVSGSHIPTALTFDVSEDGVYTLSAYWEPRDGSFYPSDIREKFPKSAAEDAMDAQKYILEHKQNCYAQAVAYGKVDTERMIGQLFEAILSSPASSSNPDDYIAAHALEYRELLYYGDYTLRYCFHAFLKGGQTGLKGHIMRSVMDDLIGNEAIKLSADTGQAYFDAWRAWAEQTRLQNGDEYMQENLPKAWLLLQTMDQKR